MVKRLVRFSIKHPWLVICFFSALSLFIIAGVFWKGVMVDTDPENMLSKDESVRVFYHSVKREFNLHDMLVLGIVNTKDPDGVFNPKTLNTIYRLTEMIKTMEGVVPADIISPSTVDHIEQAGPGTVKFSWLMSKPPSTREEARAIGQKIKSNPMLDGTLVSEDGKALCLFIPLESKDKTYEVSKEIKQFFNALDPDDQFFMTGLPVAEDTFGVEMFRQMAISAPLAMIVIFLLMYLFFHSFTMILSPMIIAVIAVICAMGLLILTGNTLHIMSSMIPIFLMPISVLDSIHILSEFFDRIRENGGNREKILTGVMDELSSPMLFTSLTTIAGFGSMALTPIPPVQVFGIFVALGVFLAWLMTVTFIPAYTMVLSDNTIKRMSGTGEKRENAWFSLALKKMGQVSFHRAGTIIVITVILIVFSVYGIGRIEVNDNPVKWFGKNHPIRVSDRVLNEHFGGTYMAYMILEAKDSKETLEKEIIMTLDGLSALKEEFFDLTYMDEAVKKVKELVRETGRMHLDRRDYSLKSYYREINETLEPFLDDASDETYDTWYEIRAFMDEQSLSAQVFKNPEMLAYMEKLEDAVKEAGVVGKTNSVATLVKKVYMELMGGGEEHFRMPDSIGAVGQSLLSFQNSHKPNDLWHLVTPDYTKSNIWVQLKSGDNRDMTKAVMIAGHFLQDNPPPFPVDLKWSGLTYLNVIWQEKMVWGMLNSFAGSFIIVLVMMIFLFRSLITGLLSMIPLSVTIMFIYALIGVGGKSYDMPVAVLSSMTLGLSIDFAIHFLERSKNVFQRLSGFQDTIIYMFDEPARAIARNAIVIAVGFLPLLAAPLVPYKTVGFFLAGIMAASSVATLFILPALAKVFQRFIYKKAKKVSIVCNCIFCSSLSAFLILGVAYVMHQYSLFRWSHTTWIAVLGVLASMTLCYVTSRREICRMARETKKEDN